MLDLFLQPDPYGFLLLFWSWLWSWLRRFPGGGKLIQLLSLDGTALVYIGVKYCRRTRNPPLLDLPLVCVKSWSSGGSEMVTGSRDCWEASHWGGGASESSLARLRATRVVPHLTWSSTCGSTWTPLWSSPCSKFSIWISTNQRPAWYHHLALTT